jgi:hypothetical protein
MKRGRKAGAYSSFITLVGSVLYGPIHAKVPSDVSVGCGYSNEVFVSSVTSIGTRVFDHP